jgi:hypothetical protein
VCKNFRCKILTLEFCTVQHYNGVDGVIKHIELSTQYRSSLQIFLLLTMSSIPWPYTGNNSQYFILDIPYLLDSTLDVSLAFISGLCYYKETSNRDKFLKFPGITPIPMEHPGNTVMLESLFLNPTQEGANEAGNQDMHRFQTHPDAQDALYSNHAISDIVQKVSSTVLQLTKTLYLPQKISVLFSRPNGLEQGLHYDDGRDEDTINQQGEMLSVIVALMHNTTVDIATVNNGRRLSRFPKAQ